MERVKKGYDIEWFLGDQVRGRSGESMDMDLASIIQFFKKVRSFEHLDDEALKEIAGYATPVQYKKGDYIFQEEEEPKYFHIVMNGRVKLFKTSSLGKQLIAYISIPFEPLCGVVLFIEKRHFLSAQALSDVTILQIIKEKYLSFVYNNPIMASKIIGILGRLLSSSFDRMIDIVGETAEQRVHNVLYMLYNKYGEMLPFTCECIADFSGTTTETVIRIISKLKNANILDAKRSRGEIHVVDHAALRELSRGPFFI